MAIERVRVGYTRLFEVHLLHHYWLDDGRTVFDSLDDATRRKRLLTYDVRRILAVTPGSSTVALINGLGGVCRTTGLGIVVAVPDDAVLPTDASFTFFVTPVSPDYPNYTALTLRPGTEVHAVEKSNDPNEPDIIHRYKRDVPLLSNATGTARDTGGTRHLFLSRRPVDDPASGDRVEALVTVDSELRQLTSDPPGASLAVLGAVEELPVYVNQGDIEVVPPPGGSLRGIELTPDTPPTVALAIRLDAHVPGKAEMSFVDDNGRPTPLVFEVRLRNRWTFWEYRDRRTGSVIGGTRDLLPLTYFGNAAGGGEKPSTEAIHIERAPGDPPPVKQLVSPIYIQPTP